jgi:hypothetical protein
MNHVQLQKNDNKIKRLIPTQDKVKHARRELLDPVENDETIKRQDKHDLGKTKPDRPGNTRQIETIRKTRQGKRQYTTTQYKTIYDKTKRVPLLMPVVRRSLLSGG